MQLSRRQFLVASLGAAAYACSGGDGGTRPAPAGSLDLPGPAFQLGVASGDPLPESVILWTRLASEPLDGGGMPDEPVDVAWDVAVDRNFDDLVQSGTATASPELAHSLHVDAQGLEPATDYFYRFRLGDEVSPVGRTRTLPDAGSSPDRVRLAVASCHGREWGSYAAYRHMVEQDVDLVVFLGDYIYEYAPETVAPRSPRSHVGGEAITLADYRNRYAQYQTDEDLQAAHRAVPWVATWDDHEAANNYAGSVPGEGVGTTPMSPDEFDARRAAAYQAWYEHLPVRIDPPEGPGARIHHDLAFGDLAQLYLLDTRQHADVPPCRDTSTIDVGQGCAEQEDAGRTMLGQEQEEWLAGALADSDARWNALANPVMMAGLDTSSSGVEPEFFLDSWDGYPAARRRLVEALTDSGARNPLVVTGDYHATFVSDLKADPFDPQSPAVATEFVGAAISSVPFDPDYTADNPHVRYFDPRNGYMLCTVEPDRWLSEIVLVEDVADPASAVTVEAGFVLRDGSPTAEPV